MFCASPLITCELLQGEFADDVPQSVPALAFERGRPLLAKRGDFSLKKMGKQVPTKRQHKDQDTRQMRPHLGKFCPDNLGQFALEEASVRAPPIRWPMHIQPHLASVRGGEDLCVSGDPQSHCGNEILICLAPKCRSAPPRCHRCSVELHLPRGKKKQKKETKKLIK